MIELYEGCLWPRSRSADWQHREENASAGVLLEGEDADGIAANFFQHGLLGKLMPLRVADDDLSR